MESYYSNFYGALYRGDCLDVLRALPDGFINTCVTSPPYFGLRDYGTDGQIGLEDTPEEYVGRLVEVFREVRRVLRDDGTLWLNLGDSYNAHPGQRKVTDKAGGKQQTQRGSTGAPSRCVDGLKPKDLIGIPWRVAFALQADGWYLRQDIIWNKPNPMPESVRDRCTKAHEYIFLLSKSPRYYFDAEAIKEPSSGQSGAAANFKRTTKEADPPGQKYKQHREGRKPTDDTGTRNRRSVWTVTPKPYKGAHFATFPPDLIAPCILAGAPPGGIVLDPFGGSGTTAATAQSLGRCWLSSELNQDYCRLHVDRVGAAA